MTNLSKYETHEKHDVVDWAGMPDGKCNMNFRVPNALTESPSETIKFLHVASLAGGVSAISALAIVPRFTGAVSATNLGVFLLLAASIPFLKSKTTRFDRAATAPYFALLLVVASTYLIAQVDQPIGYCVVGLLAAFALTLWLSDKIATLFIYWLSASPKLGHREMQSIRALWNSRFHGQSAVDPSSRSLEAIHQRIRSYPTALFIVSLGLLTTLGCVIAFDRTSWFGLSCLLCILLVGASAMATLESSGQRIVTVTWHAIRFFVEYGQGRRLTAWCFKSPVGTSHLRQASLIATLMVVGFASTSLFHYGNAGVSIGRTSQWLVIFGIKILVAFAFPFPFAFVATALAVGPMLRAVESACEGPTATLARSNSTEFDCYVDRIQSSSNRLERDSIWMGFHHQISIPILLSVSLLSEHVHILGPTGSGKTGLGLSTLVAQLIRRGDGPVIVIDGKGDHSFLHSSRIWAEHAGRKFKWFTTAHGRSTYAFNPLDQSHLGSLTLQEIVGLFLSSFNLNHGDDYGRAWFAAAAKAAYTLSIKETGVNRPVSFRQFQRTVERIMSEHKEFKAAQHLLFVMQSLAEFEQINLSSRANSHPACKYAIHMPDVIANNEVVYFSFESLTDPISTGEISRLAMYSLISAATAYKEQHGRPANVYFVIDEAQNVIAKNISAVLEQARSNGLACVLSHQTRGQLNPPGGVDLREVVDSCTCVKQFFSARDPNSRQYLKDISGEVGYYTARWNQFVGDVQLGRAGMQHALGKDLDPAIASITEFVGPRLTDADIMEINHQQNLAALAVERYEGFSRFRGAFPIHIDYPISETDYIDRSTKMRWPTASGETLDVQPFWPVANDETMPSSGTKVEWEHPTGLSPADLDTLKKSIFKNRKLGD